MLPEPRKYLDGAGPHGTDGRGCESNRHQIYNNATRTPKRTKKSACRLDLYTRGSEMDLVCFRPPVPAESAVSWQVQSRLQDGPLRNYMISF